MQEKTFCEVVGMEADKCDTGAKQRSITRRAGRRLPGHAPKDGRAAAGRATARASNAETTRKRAGRRRLSSGVMVMIEKLKPCPFCGGKAILAYDSSSDESCQTMYTVECENCIANISWDTSKLKAIAAWNRRVKK